MSYIGKNPEAAGGVPIMSVLWFPSRAYLPAGFIPADGQLLSRDVYPGAWDEVNNGRVPIVTEAAWATPTNRGSFTVGDGSTTFRLPDYNGKSSGSLGATFLRGDGTNSAGTNGIIQQDDFKSHTHTWVNDNKFGSNYGAGQQVSNGMTAAASTSNGSAITGSNQPTGGTETRPLNVTGCFAIKLFGVITTADMLNTQAVSSQVSALTARAGDSTQLRLVGSTGNGTTNTRYRVFSTTVSNDALNLSWSNSAANGLMVTVLNAGRYSISYSDASPVGATHIAIMLNDNQPTTVLDSTTGANVLAASTSASASWYASSSWTGWLPAGSVIVPKLDNGGAATRSSFNMVRIN